MRFFAILASTMVIIGDCCSHGVLIRKPRESEIISIVDKFNKHISWTELTYDLVRENLKNIYLACDDQNNPVTYLRMTLIGENTVYINALVTLPNFRRKGYAKSLIDNIKTRYPYRTIQLTPSTEAIGFYKKMNFGYLAYANFCIYAPPELAIQYF